jgi:hypothetical protein
MRYVIAAAAATVLLAACSSSSSRIAGTASHGTVAPHATSPSRSPAAAIIGDGLKAAGMPIRHLVVYTPVTDPDHMMGRQGGYTSKVEWVDPRAIKAGAAGKPSGGGGGVAWGGGIEVFPTVAGAQARDRYIRTFAGTFIGDGWDYVAGTAVLRLSNYLTPGQASAYLAAFRKAAG